MSARPASGRPGRAGPAGAMSRAAVISALAVLLVAGAGIALSVARHEAESRRKWLDRLLATADERRAAVEEYLDERLEDASVFAAFPSLREAATSADGPSRERNVRHLVDVLESGRQRWRSRTLAVLDRSSSDVVVGGEPVSPEVREALRSGPAGRRAVFVRTPAGARLVFAAPVEAPAGETGSGWLLLVDDAALHLWPLLHREPAATRTGEAFLVRESAGEIEFLSPLRKLGPGEEPPRIPVGSTAIVSRDAILGRQGADTYFDYRGHEVLAAVRQIAGPSWGLVVKVDVEEALGENVRARLWGGAAFALLALGLYAFVRLMQGSERLVRAEEERRQDERHRTVLENVRDAVVWVRPEDGRFLEANRAAESLWGYTRAELLQRTIHDIRVPEERPTIRPQLEQARREGILLRTRHRRKDGSAIAVEVSSRPVVLDGEDVVAAVIRNVSENEAMIARVRLLNRLLRTIAAVDQALVGVRDRRTILERVCGEIVSTGEFAAAWFGVPDGEGRLRPEASAGGAEGHPGEAELSLGGPAAGRSAAAIAYLEERTVVVDGGGDPLVGPVPEAGASRVGRSSAATPVRGGGDVSGVLAIHAGEPHAFGPDAVLLLEELARDVGLALDLADTDARRSSAEASLAASEARYRKLFEENPAPMWVFDVETLRFLDANEATTALYGWSREELLAMTLRELRPPEDVPVLEDDVLVPRTGIRRSGPWRHFRKDGSELRVEIVTYDIDFEGRVARLVLANDVTERLRAEEKLRVFFDAGLFGAIFGSVDGRVFAANDEFLRIVGRSRAELDAGRLDWAEITPPEWLPVDAERIAEAKAAGVCTPYEKEYLRPDGTRVPVLGGFALVGEAREESVAFVLDLTERKAAEVRLAETTRLLQAVVEGSPAPILTLDREGRVTSWNPAAEAVFGWRAEEVSGQPLPIVPPENEAEFRSFLGDVLSGASFAGREARRRRRDGAPVDVALAAAPLRGADGAVSGIAAVLVDVSARVRAEAEVRRLNAELEQRVERRTEELLAKSKELEGFAYSISHDLRAPLRAIDGFSRILAEEQASRLDGEGLRLLEVIRGNARRMGQLIDDLLSFSRAGRHELRRSRVDVGDLVRSVLEEVLPAEERGRSDVTVGELPSAEADPALLRQVFVNLLSNAVKFSATRARRSICVEGRREPDRVVYDVSDNGVGFDMQYAGKLFGVFQRLHGREFDGTGVGLALVERIVGRHGGTVSGHGELDRGATFRVTLPDRGGTG